MITTPSDPVRIVNSEEQLYPADLNLGAKSITLTLAAGVGSVPIPDSAKICGVLPVSTTMRFGLEAPEADGTATGNATAANLKKGLPAGSDGYLWFRLPATTGRILYVKGGAADVTEVVFL